MWVFNWTNFYFTLFIVHRQLSDDKWSTLINENYVSNSKSRKQKHGQYYIPDGHIFGGHIYIIILLNYCCEISLHNFCIWDQWIWCLWTKIIQYYNIIQFGIKVCEPLFAQHCSSAIICNIIETVFVRAYENTYKFVLISKSNNLFIDFIWEMYTKFVLNYYKVVQKEKLLKNAMFCGKGVQNLLFP